MTFGPVQVLVVEVPDDERAHEVSRTVGAALDDGPVRVLDSFVVTRSADGEFVVDESGADGGGRSVELFGEMGDADDPSLSGDESWHLGDVVPPGSQAVVVLLEHRWATGLRDSMHAAGADLRFETWLDDEDRERLATLLA